MNCLRLPQSLEDAESIIVACYGPDWRPNFLIGLGTVVVVILVAVTIMILVRNRKTGNEDGYD